MTSILNKIIKDKRIEVEQAKKDLSIEELKLQVQDLPRCRNFYKAVTKPNVRGLNVIAEVKKASPSAGLIRADFDPVKIAKIYESCSADSISVLTDEKYFQGRLEYLTAIKKAVSLPVLRKDFIIDPWQVYQARAAGADAILLIAEALDSSQISDFLILASSLTLTVLLEAHQADTLLSVRSFADFPQKGYCILGVNNRDLNTMTVDINTVCRFKDLLDEDLPVVAESGIKTRADVEKLIAARINAVLIGQTLCENEDIEQKFTELFGR